MDAFGDDFTNTPPEDNTGFGDDPAADFLAREEVIIMLTFHLQLKH